MGSGLAARHKGAQQGTATAAAARLSRCAGMHAANPHLCLQLLVICCWCSPATALLLLKVESCRYAAAERPM